MFKWHDALRPPPDELVETELCRSVLDRAFE
jgi:hypothetical protein